MARLRYEGRTYQLAEDVWHAVKYQLQALKVLGSCYLAHLVNSVQVILRQVLNLHQAASPAASSTSAVVLLQASDSVVLADRRRHSLVLGRAGLSQQQAKLQHSAQGRLCDTVVQPGLNHSLTQGIRVYSRRGQPVLKLRHAVRVVQTCESLHFCHTLGCQLLVDRDSSLGELRIYLHAALIDTGVQGPDSSLEVCHLVASQLLMYCLADLYVPDAVTYEALPLIRGVLWQVSSPAAV